MILASTVRIPSEIYKTLQDMKVSLESEHYSAAPTLQDLVTVAIKRFIRDWNNPNERSQIQDELFRNRREARSRMGKRQKPDNDSDK